MPRVNGFGVLSIICWQELLSYIIDIKYPIIEKYLRIVPVGVVLWGTRFIDTHTIRFYYKIDEVSDGFRTIDAHMNNSVSQDYVDMEAILAEYARQAFVKHYRFSRNSTQVFKPITVSYIPSHSDGVIILAEHGFQIHILHWDQLSTVKMFNDDYYDFSK